MIDLHKNQHLISDRYIETTAKLAKQTATHGKSYPNNDSATSELFGPNHLFVGLHNYSSKEDHCHYNGLVRETHGHNMAAMSLIDNRSIVGVFQHAHRTYHVIANETLSPHRHTLDNKTKATREVETFGSRSDRARRSIKPDNYVIQEPFQADSRSLYVELLVVHDHSQYMYYNSNSSLIAERTMQIVNILSAFYRQLNIFVTLVGVVVWTDKDEIRLSEDGDATLTNFLKYRNEKLLPKYHHDNAQLITSTPFSDSVVGKALRGPICTHEHSGGVNTDHSHNPAIVAVTLAHELGHNFGMEHDEEHRCKCPDEMCIMSSSSSSVHPKHWSSCSIAYLNEARERGLLDCLGNMPKRVYGPVCGNGLVEDGEDCDVGEPLPSYGTSKSVASSSNVAARGTNQPAGSGAEMLNPCCNRRTCKFVANATCAQGPCCDLDKCSVFAPAPDKPARVCRPRRGECDFDELCDGSSEFCPPDAHYHDGIECGPLAGIAHDRDASDAAAAAAAALETSESRSRSYCFQGRCASHDTQCRRLWGPSGGVSRDICYEQNVHGNTSGNCGYNRRDKLYEACEPEDAICGMLHCVHDQLPIAETTQSPGGGGGTTSSAVARKTGKLAYGFESAAILTVSFFVMNNRAKIYCHGAIIDAGPDMRDPGLVPNGAACGHDRMCLNQKCVQIEDVLYQNWCPSDCSGNGICDNRGVCHCNDGTIGSSCYHFFGPNFHLSLLLYIFVFFVPMGALIVFAFKHYKQQIKVWWFLHNRKIELVNIARDPKHHPHVPYDIARDKVTISEPIPLNHSNTNYAHRSLFTDSSTGRPNSLTAPAAHYDPWAESSTSAPGWGTQSGAVAATLATSLTGDASAPSYRLEPASTSAFSSNLRPVREAPPPPVPAHARTNNSDR